MKTLSDFVAFAKRDPKSAIALLALIVAILGLMTAVKAMTLTTG